MTTLTRLYDDYTDAEVAVLELERIGVPHSDISIIANNVDAAHGEHDDDRSKAAEDAGAGAGIGAAIGGVGGLLAGLGMLAIPGVGPVVAAGWLATTALGAGVGAVAGGATGGLIGALQSKGVSEHHAHVYAEGVRRGGTLVTAYVAGNLAAEAEAVLDRNGVVDPEARGQAYAEGGWTRFDGDAPAYDVHEMARERSLRGRVDTTVI
jgi:hypothetical protein